MRDFGIGTKSTESRIQDDLHELLQTILKSDGVAIESTGIFNSSIIHSLLSVVMTDKLEKAKLDHLAYIVQEK